MDEYEIAADIRESILSADAFTGSQIREPFGATAGFIVDTAIDGTFLVTVTRIED